MTLERLCERIWNPWLLGAFLFIGLYFSARTGFFQLFGLPAWLKATAGTLFSRQTGEQKGLTQFQTISTALAATIGTGSIAGVATAIFFGGPGAVFWMWVSAFLGMMISFAEKTLTIRYRRRAGNGWKGGPMEYMEQGLGSKWMAIWFAAALCAAALAGGALVQSHSISSGLSAAFGWGRLPIGVATALLTGAVIFGGIGRIGKVCEAVVPLMAVGFLLGGGAVLYCRADAILPAVREIFICAFEPEAAAVGGAGYGIMTALRYGVARGIFTNEAGLGTSALAHAQAKVSHPSQQGMWGILEVFISTVMICTMSALVILVSGVYDRDIALTAIENKTVEEWMTGVPMAAAAFSSVMGTWGSVFVAACLLLFAFSSLLGWSYYGERGLSFLLRRERGTVVFRGLFLAAIVWGSVGELTAVWQLSDLCNAMMAMPNLTALLLLSPEAVRLWKEWMQKTSEG